MDKRYMAIGTSMLVLKLLEEEPDVYKRQVLPEKPLLSAFHQSVHLVHLPASDNFW